MSRLWENLKQFTLQPLADLFIPKPLRLLMEAFSQTVITAQMLFVHKSTSVYSQVPIYTAECTVATWGERNCPSFETTARVIEPGISRLRVRCSNRTPPCLNYTRNGNIHQRACVKASANLQRIKLQIADNPLLVVIVSLPRERSPTLFLLALKCGLN